MIFCDMKMLRRSVNGTVSGRVGGLYHRPRTHAFNLFKGAQRSKIFTKRSFGRKQGAAYGSGMGGAWFGAGAYGAGGNNWLYVFDQWFGTESIDVDVLIFHDEYGSRDLRDEDMFTAPYTAEEVEALALRIRRRMEYFYVTPNEQQRLYVECCKALVDALEGIAKAKRTMGRVSMEIHVILINVITKFIGDGAPLLLTTMSDMEMLTEIHQKLNAAWTLSHTTTMLSELKKAGCTSVEVAERCREALSRRRTSEDAERCISLAMLITTGVDIAPEQWFSAEDEKLLLLVAEQLRQAHEIATKKLGQSMVMLTWKKNMAQ